MRVVGVTSPGNRLIDYETQRKSVGCFPPYRDVTAKKAGQFG